MLLAREVERRLLDRIVAAARAGRSQVVVLHGDPGIGKTSLLEYVLETAEGCRVARIAGVQSEMELPFAGLQQLVSQLPDRWDLLPEHQSLALQSAVGQAATGVSSPYLVDVAALNLISAVARDQPLVCVVDDAHWLDRESSQALAFIARRIHATSVALVFARRRSLPAGDLAGLPELDIGGLSVAESHALLRSALAGRLDREVEARLVAEARGNPLALLELPLASSPHALAGGFAVADLDSVSAPLDSSFVQRIRRLPEPARMLMLVAAADPTGDAGLLWRAAAHLGLDSTALVPAQDEGLLTVGAIVRFRHPLVRSAAYQASPPDDRRKAHRALAEVTDALHDPDRRAWHRALSTTGPDESVADELERSADRAQARGGLFAAAAFLERTVELTVDPQTRARRALAAARLKDLAGARDAAVQLLGVAEAGRLGARDRALARHLRGRIALTVDRGQDAARLLLEAAQLMEPLDRSASREMYLEALTAATFVADLSPGASSMEVARGAQAAASQTINPSATDLMLAGFAALVADGPAAAAPHLKSAVSALTDADLPPEVGLRWMWLGCRLAALAWDEIAWGAIAEQGTLLARAAGSSIALPAVLSSYAAWHSLVGDLQSASRAADEAAQTWQSIGMPSPPYAAAVVAAYSGDEDRARHLFDSEEPELRRRGEGMGIAAIHWARALLFNSLGRYVEAEVQARAAASYPAGMLYVDWGLVEQVEAASRTGNHLAGGEALERLSASTSASGTDWARGVEARSRALLDPADSAEDLYQEAIYHLGRTSLRTELGRTQLVYGEWLRRQRRRQDARAQLSLAHDFFTSMGAHAFAERAQQELAAAGATPVRAARTEDERALSTQEQRVAELASQGLSNVDIAATMFISTSTVDYHLRKVYRKLGVTSRTKLHLVLEQRDRSAELGQTT